MELKSRFKRGDEVLYLDNVNKIIRKIKIKSFTFKNDNLYYIDDRDLEFWSCRCYASLKEYRRTVLSKTESSLDNIEKFFNDSKTGYSIAFSNVFDCIINDEKVTY